jgi:hypothetical protein
MGEIETFPTWMERTTKVAKTLLKEIIPRFGLPWTLQSDNGQAFILQVTQGVLQALGIKYIYIQLGDPSPLVRKKGPIKQSNEPWLNLAKRPLENGPNFCL